MNYSQGKKKVPEILTCSCVEQKMNELLNFNRCGEVSRR